MLVNCNECRGLVSTSASYCPHCGCTSFSYPQRITSRFKKIDFEGYTYCKTCSDKVYPPEFLCRRCNKISLTGRLSLIKEAFDQGKPYSYCGALGEMLFTNMKDETISIIFDQQRNVHILIRLVKHSRKSWYEDYYVKNCKNAADEVECRIAYDEEGCLCVETIIGKENFSIKALLNGCILTGLKLERLRTTLSLYHNYIF